VMGDSISLFADSIMFMKSWGFWCSRPALAAGVLARSPASNLAGDTGDAFLNRSPPSWPAQL
jgi:hypothetical protein